MGGDDASEGSVTDLLTRARRSLERARALDESLAPTVEHLDRIVESVAVAAGELAAYAREVDADPARQAEVEERRQAISALKRRYGPELDDVLAWWAAAQESVSAVDGADARVGELAARVQDLQGRVVDGQRPS